MQHSYSTGLRHVKRWQKPTLNAGAASFQEMLRGAISTSSQSHANSPTSSATTAACTDSGYRGEQGNYQLRRLLSALV